MRLGRSPSSSDCTSGHPSTPSVRRWARTEAAAAHVPPAWRRPDGGHRRDRRPADERRRWRGRVPPRRRLRVTRCPTRLVLWTRVTPSASRHARLRRRARHGGRAGRSPSDAGVHPGRARRATSAPTPAADHTVKVDVGRPRPGDRPTGTASPRSASRRRSGAPAPRPPPAPTWPSLRFGVVSCSNWEGGFFSAYRHLAARDDLDFVLHLGDYVYEYAVGGYGQGPASDASHDPTHEMSSLERLPAPPRAVQDRPRPPGAARIATRDRHDRRPRGHRQLVARRRGEPPAGDRGRLRGAPGAGVPGLLRVDADPGTGGADEPTRIYRRCAFGALADLFMLDERTYRDEQVAGGQRVALRHQQRASPIPAGRCSAPSSSTWLDGGPRRVRPRSGSSSATA